MKGSQTILMNPSQLIRGRCCGSAYQTGFLRLYVMFKDGYVMCPVCINGEAVDRVLELVAKTTIKMGWNKEVWRN